MHRTYREDIELIGRAERFWRPIHEAVDWKGRWLWDGEHYDEEGRDVPERDRRQLRWVGQETLNVARHEVGAVTQASSSVHARPIDEDGDPVLAEHAVAVVESEVEDPIKCFEDVCEEWVGAAAVLGYGYVGIEFHEHVGPWGELSYFAGDSRDLMWDPRAKSPHSPSCRWVMERRRVPRSECKGRRGWKASVVNALEPDAGYDGDWFGRSRETSMAARIARDGGAGEQWDPGDEVTLYFLWYRAGRQAKRAKPETFRPLEQGARYMHCASCGWQSATEAEMGVEEFPETSVCDTCGGEALRAGGEEQVQAVRGYPDIRLKIIAPYQGVDQYAYNGPAPWPTRSFPIGFLTRFVHPFKPNPPSLVDLNAYNQQCTDMLMTLAIERMAASAPIWSMPDDGIEDAFGQRFEFSDEQGHVMFRSQNIGADAVQLLEGTGIPANWSSVYQSAVGSLVSHQGIADLGMAPTQTRDIAASSLAQQIQQQEIPVAHFQRRYQRARGMLYGLIFDAIKGTYPPERVARTRGMDGADTVAALNAADLPNFDFILMDAPDFTAMDEAKTRGFQQLVGLAAQSPAMFELAASIYNIPPSFARKMREAAESDAARLAAVSPAPGGVMGEPQGQAGAPAAVPPEAQGEALPEDAGPMVEDLIAQLMGQEAQWSQ